MARRRNRFADRAALDSLLRFGPQLSGLRELQLAAQSQFQGSVRGARATERGTRMAVNAARPQVQQIYDRAGERTAATNAVIGPGMEGVPASMQAAIQQEQSGFGRRLEESRAASLSDLESRKVGAVEGKGAALRAARDQFGSDLAQIARQRQDVTAQQGLYTASRAAELEEAATAEANRFALKQMGLDAAERRSLRTSGIDPDTGQPIPGGKLDPKPPKGKGNKGRGWASQEQHAAAQDTVGSALNDVKSLRKAGASRAEIAELMMAGADEQKIQLHNPQTGKPLYNKDGTPKMRNVPGVDKVKSQLLLSVALDQVFLGHISARNMKLLRQRKLRPWVLGVTTLKQWREAALNSPMGQHPRT